MVTIMQVIINPGIPEPDTLSRGKYSAELKRTYLLPSFLRSSPINTDKDVADKEGI
jgi:hypothetical protein